MAAILIDLVLVAVVSIAGGVVLGLLVAALLARIALGSREDARSASVPQLAFRSSVGCLGAIVLLATVTSLWSALQFGFLAGPPNRGDAGPGGEARPVELTRLAEGMRGARDLREADSEAEAREAARGTAAWLRQAGVPEAEIVELVESLAPADAPWRARVREWDLTPAGADEPGAREEAGPDPGMQAEAPPDVGTQAAADTAAPPGAQADPAPDSLPLPEALRRYAELVSDADPTPEGDTAQALRARLLSALAGDTLDALSDELAEEREARVEATRALLATREDDGGLRAWIRGVADDLGIGLGWGALYFSFFTAWWNGRTPGKRLLGLRVVRLDGQPMGWWAAFERYGGYAAGFATGLLGFAQVYWDPNRQGIHDRIAGTAVVLDGRPALSTHDREQA